MKNTVKLIALVAVIGFSMIGCPADPSSENPPLSAPPAFTAVTNITGVPSYKQTDTDLTLSGTVQPANATNKTIVWSIAATNTLSGATVANGVLKTPTAGTATVTATVTNGASATANYTKNFSITVTSASSAYPFDDISAAELVANIKIGWNLGNTLDAHSDKYEANTSVSTLETLWSNPVTTKAMITTLKNAGFNGIRIPVSWFKAADSDYKIRADWMARVVQVVDYAVDNDMYILLNTHHDEHIFKFTNAEKTESLRAFKKIWEQIADTFKNYDEKLIFEGLNEPRTIGSAAEWNGGTAEEQNNLNILHQLFVDTVRESGGNNVKRILMVSTYAASATATAMNGLIIPADPLNTSNKIIVSIHAYVPYDFALNEKSNVTAWSKNNLSDTMPITEWVDRADNLFVSRGIPVILGEFGSLGRNPEAVRSEWAEYYVSYANSKGIKCFWWDDGGSIKLLNRRTNTFYYPQIVAALMRGSE